VVNEKKKNDFIAETGFVPSLRSNRRVRGCRSSRVEEEKRSEEVKRRDESWLRNASGGGKEAERAVESEMGLWRA
jgi:hypothetical protein